MQTDQPTWVSSLDSPIMLTGTSLLCLRRVRRVWETEILFSSFDYKVVSNIITMPPRHVYREEYTGRWTNVNIFTGALTLGRMMDITKPDGQVIPCHQSDNWCANNHHLSFCHFIQHGFLPIPVSILILNTLFANQECGTAGDFLSWAKIVFPLIFNYQSFDLCPKSWMVSP